MTYANRYNPQLSNLNPVLGEIQLPSSHQQFERKNLTFPIRVLQTKIRSLSACLGYEACFWTHRDCPCREAAREVELSEEDMALKENLELMVVRSADPKAGVAKLAMETMRSEIKSATR